MADADGPTVASTVYQKLLDEEMFDLNNVPYALNDAVRLLREEKVDAERWAVFVHMGAKDLARIVNAAYGVRLLL
jgi:hypothetical protein